MGGDDPEASDEADQPAGDRSRSAGNPPAEMTLYDAHVHLVPQATLGRDPLLAADLVEWMDEQGVDRAVVLPLASPEAYPVYAPSWWGVEQAQQHPDRLIPFFTLDPRTGGAFGEDVIAEQFEIYVEDEGVQGFGEYKPGIEVGDERNDVIFELCAQYDLPLLFHSDNKAFMDDVEHSQLEDVLASYPDVDFLGHGMGWWARISGDVTADELSGYPPGPVEDGGAVPRLLAEYDNIYGELSGRSGYHAMTRSGGFGQVFMEEHADQLIFGTDYLHPDHNVPNFELFDIFQLDDDAWADIRYRNLESVLRG